MTAARHLVVPGLFAAAPGSPGMRPGSRQSPRYPHLERVLGRARERVAVVGYAETLFALFGLAPPPDADLPTAAVCYRADSGLASDAFLLHADPVHLVPDQDRLLLFPVPPASLTAALEAAYVAAFNGHFAADGLELLAPVPGHWYVRADRDHQVRTAPLSAVARRNVDAYLPRGPDAAAWRQYLNETQMLFHPLAASAESDMPVNGLWFSGAGRLPHQPSRAVVVERADAALARGLAALAPTAGAGAVVRLRVEESLLRADLTGDADLRQASLLRLEAEVAELSGAELSLYPCDGRSFHWRPRDRWRWWRRPHPVTGGLADLPAPRQPTR